MAFVLYGYPDNASLVVRLALEELELQYSYALVDRRVGEQKGDAYRTLNPRGLIPVLVDEDKQATLFETAAILLYLADGEGHLGPGPERSAARGAFLKWLFFLSNTLHADARILFYAERYVEGLGDAPSLRAKIRARLKDHLGLIEGALQSHEGPWLLDSGLSVCDFYVAALARWLLIYPLQGHLGPELLQQFPQLETLLTELEARPSVLRAFEKEGIPGFPFLDPQPYPQV